MAIFWAGGNIFTGRKRAILRPPSVNVANKASLGGGGGFLGQSPLVFALSVVLAWGKGMEGLLGLLIGWEADSGLIGEGLPPSAQVQGDYYSEQPARLGYFPSSVVQESQYLKPGKVEVKTDVSVASFLPPPLAESKPAGWAHWNRTPQDISTPSFPSAQPWPVWGLWALSSTRHVTGGVCPP